MVSGGSISRRDLEVEVAPRAGLRSFDWLPKRDVTRYDSLRTPLPLY